MFEDGSEEVHAAEKCLLADRFISDHNFGEELYVGVLECCFNFHHAGGHLLAALAKKSQVIVEKCEEWLVGVVNHFRMENLQNL